MIQVHHYLKQWRSIELPMQTSPHDDVIKWKHIPRYWPFVRGTTGHQWIPLTKAFRVTDPLWGEPPVTGGFPSQRPVMQSFVVFFDLRLNKPVSKQSKRWWFETPSRSLWRHCNEFQPHSCCARRHGSDHIDWLVQERRNSTALAMELRISCTNTSILAIQILCGLPIICLITHT